MNDNRISPSFKTFCLRWDYHDRFERYFDARNEHFQKLFLRFAISLQYFTRNWASKRHSCILAWQQRIEEWKRKRQHRSSMKDIFLILYRWQENWKMEIIVHVTFYIVFPPLNHINDYVVRAIESIKQIVLTFFYAQFESRMDHVVIF